MFRVVLHEPEIPNNTGNIGRTCVATGCSLDLIGPLGFDTSEKACRRAGLDYWPRLAPRHHASWDAFVGASGVGAGGGRGLWLFTTRGSRAVWDAPIAPGDALVFGKETRGLPDWLLERYPDRLVVLPMVEGERSLNLATAVCAAVYEGLRRAVADGHATLGPGGRLRAGTGGSGTVDRG